MLIGTLQDYTLKIYGYYWVIILEISIVSLTLISALCALYYDRSQNNILSLTSE